MLQPDPRSGEGCITLLHSGFAKVHVDTQKRILYRHIPSLLYSKRIYSANGNLRYFFPRISAFSRSTKMHLNGMLLIETEFCKIIVPL